MWHGCSPTPWESTARSGPILRHTAASQLHVAQPGLDQRLQVLNIANAGLTTGWAHRMSSLFSVTGFSMAVSAITCGSTKRPQSLASEQQCVLALNGVQLPLLSSNEV